MSQASEEKTCCGYAVQGKPAPMLLVALNALERTGAVPQALPGCNGSTSAWVQGIAGGLSQGKCKAAVLFCEDPELACCVANKVTGIRAASVHSVGQARRALEQLGANMLVVEMAGKTFFEFKALLGLAGNGSTTCPASVARALMELDGHAHS
jgi:hypothetical protein